MGQEEYEKRITSTDFDFEVYICTSGTEIQWANSAQTFRICNKTHQGQ